MLRKSGTLPVMLNQHMTGYKARSKGFKQYSKGWGHGGSIYKVK
jgi:hypothetical protein